MRFLKPAEIITLFLTFLYVLAVLLKGQTFYFSEGLRFLALTVSFTLPTVVFMKLKKVHVQWDNILITLLILLLLADPTAPLLLTVALGLLTYLFKIFIRVQHHPVFNPAAISLALLYPFGLTTTWWGVSFSPRFFEIGVSTAMLITLPLGLYLIKRYQKLPTLIATVVSFAVLSFFLQGSLPVKILIEGTFAFFLLIMATEPKTTPVVDKQEWFYGTALGLSLAVWFVYKLPLPYLLNLLVLNILFSIYKFTQLKMATRAKLA